MAGGTDRTRLCVEKRGNMGALWIQGIKGLFKRKNLCLFAAVIFLGELAGFLTRKEDVQREAGERVSIGIVNHDTSIYSKMLLSFYQENGLFTSYVSVYLGEEEEIFSWFEEGKLDMYLVIPKDFADSMTYLEHLPVQAVISAKNPAIEIMLKNLLQGYEKYISSVEIHCVALYQVMLLSGMPRETAKEMNEKISVQLILKALAKNDFFERHILENYESVRLVPFYLHELMLLGLNFLALLLGLNFQKEHHAGIYTRLTCLGVGSFRILWQKELFFGVLLAVAGVITVFLNPFVLLSGQVVFLLFLYSCLMGAAMLFMAATLEKMKNYLLASNMFLVLGAILGGGVIPFMYLPERMKNIARFLPNYNFLCLIFDTEAGRLTTKDLAETGMLCALSIIILISLSGILYRAKEGKYYD